VNPLGLSSEGNDPSTWGTGVKMAIHRPVGILWRFSNGCQIKRKRVKHVRDKCRSSCLNFANTVQFVICFTGILSSLP